VLQRGESVVVHLSTSRQDDSWPGIARGWAILLESEERRPGNRDALRKRSAILRSPRARVCVYAYVCARVSSVRAFAPLRVHRAALSRRGTPGATIAADLSHFDEIADGRRSRKHGL